MTPTARQIIENAITGVSPEAKEWQADPDVQFMINAVSRIDDLRERLESVQILVQWAFDAGTENKTG
ncbi:MAG: hypothetical protein ACJAXU_002422 [Paracoccaceae bacterium]|jgi:hypothetical protein